MNSILAPTPTSPRRLTPPPRTSPTPLATPALPAPLPSPSSIPRPPHTPPAPPRSSPSAPRPPPPRTLTTHRDLLIPRAVGYSAALYDYFFREQLEIAAPARFVYGRTVYQPDHPEIGFGQFTNLRMKVRNTTPEEAMSNGTLTAVVHYRNLNAGG